MSKFRCAMVYDGERNDLFWVDVESDDRGARWAAEIFIRNYEADESEGYPIAAGEDVGVVIVDLDGERTEFDIHGGGFNPIYYITEIEPDAT